MQDTAAASKKPKLQPSDLSLYAAEDEEMAAPSEMPPWLMGLEDRVAVKTVSMMEARLSSIETAATNTVSAVTLLQSQVAKTMAAQNELRTQMNGMAEAFMVAQKKNEDDNASERSRSTVDTNANPYQRVAAEAIVDKTLIIVGGWPENTAAPVMVENLTKVLATYNTECGKQWTFEQVRCNGQRGKILQAKLTGDNSRTSLQKGYDFTAWLRMRNPKMLATGFRGESSDMWAVMNQPVEARNVSRTINRAVHCLHKLRELAGVPEKVQEQGFDLKLIEGRYRGKVIGAQISGVFVAIVNAQTLAIVWDYPKIAASPLRATEVQINTMMSSLTPMD